jgi:hypothetical protein
MLLSEAMIKDVTASVIHNILKVPIFIFANYIIFYYLSFVKKINLNVFNLL